MTLPGEEHAYWTIYSPLATASEKARAAAKLSDIEEIKRRNEAGRLAYIERQRAAKTCPHCGGAL